MTPRVSLHLFSLVAIVFCGSKGLQADPAPYCLSFVNLQILPIERLWEFDLHVSSAIIASFPYVPVGWRIHIDNSANWITEISGTAIEQAADLDPAVFAKNFILLAGIPPGLLKYGMTEKITVTGYLEFAHNDIRRLLPISNQNIVLTRGCGERSKP